MARPVGVRACPAAAFGCRTPRELAIRMRPSRWLRGLRCTTMRPKYRQISIQRTHKCNCVHFPGSFIRSRQGNPALFLCGCRSCNSVLRTVRRRRGSRRRVAAEALSAATRRVVDVRRVRRSARRTEGPHAAAGGPRVRLRRSHRAAPVGPTAALRRLSSRRRGRGARPTGESAARSRRAATTPNARGGRLLRPSADAPKAWPS